MGQVVNIKIKINDNLKDVAVDAESLGKAIDDVTGKTESLNTSIVRLGSISQIADAAASAFGQLNDLFKGLTDAYATQSVAETRLEQAMSNTMGASAEEVQSIKALCSAQQQLDVIGDEVQLAAAQELATYLEYSDSLKAIIPVMNDMAAQQYGLGASAESVTQIATMLGKVMNGQTEALSRYGYKFDEAQKHILQYGTEAERAAVLVDVVSQSVGGMNAAMAQTPAGRMQQITNSFGDMKERIGQTIQSMMPFVSGFNTLAQGFVTVTKLKTAFQALAKSTGLAKLESLACAVAQKTQAAAARILGVSETAAATATGVLKAQIIALQAAMTMGLSLAITGIIELISRLISRSHEAADAIGEVDEASEAFSQTSKDVRSEIAGYQVQLEDIIKHHKNDAQAVEELNAKYGESFGYYSDAATWYKVLIANSAAYCRQLGYEAMAKKYAAQIDELEDAKRDNEAKADDLKANGKVWRRGFFKNHMTDDAKEVLANQEAIESSLNSVQAKYDNAIGQMYAAGEELRSGLVKFREEETKNSVAVGWHEMSLAQLTKAIQDQKGVVESLAGVDDKQAKAENKLLKQMEARKKLLEGSYGLGSGSSGSGKKNELDGSKLIENASTYKELGNNIKYYQDALEKVKPTETEIIGQYQEEIRVLQEKQAALKAVMDAAGVPTELNTLADIDKAISYQQALRKSARAENIAGIDEEIKRLNTLKMVFETGYDPTKGDEQIQTYTQLEAALKYFQGELRDAAGEDRDLIQIRIKSLEKLKKRWDEAALSLNKPGEIGTLNTFEDLDDAITWYQDRMNKASAEEIAGIQKVIQALQAKRRMLEATSIFGEMPQQDGSGFNPFSAEQTEMEMTLSVRVEGAEYARQQIENLQKMYAFASDEQKKYIQDAIKYWQQFTGTQVDAKTKGEGVAQSISSISSVMGQLSGVVEGSTGEWLSWGSQVLSSIAEAIPKLVSLATANTAVAATGAAASVADIPYVGWILAGAAALGLAATLASIPKFADGGLAYGPTLGIFGEYAGASNNPEVVAPLDKLKDLIGTDEGGGVQKVEFSIRGDRLVALVDKRIRAIMRNR